MSTRFSRSAGTALEPATLSLKGVKNRDRCRMYVQVQQLLDFFLLQRTLTLSVATSVCVQLLPCRCGQDVTMSMSMEDGGLGCWKLCFRTDVHVCHMSIHMTSCIHVKGSGHIEELW